MCNVTSNKPNAPLEIEMIPFKYCQQSGWFLTLRDNWFLKKKKKKKKKTFKGQSYINISKYCDVQRWFLSLSQFQTWCSFNFQLYKWNNKIINEITFKWRRECVIGGFRGYVENLKWQPTLMNDT